ncbi:MAG: hypothetical protein ACRDNP_06880 [Gaiellaceae bacterium]
MITPSWVSTPTQPIALADASRYLAGVCGNQAALGESFDAGGPRGDDLPPDDGADRCPARPAAVDPQGTSANAKIVVALAPSRYACRRFGRPPLIEGLKSPTIAREERLRTLVPFELTSFDDAAGLAFGR